MIRRYDANPKDKRNCRSRPNPNPATSVQELFKFYTTKDLLIIPPKTYELRYDESFPQELKLHKKLSI